jgi:hypothetical protein
MRPGLQRTLEGALAAAVAACLLGAAAPGALAGEAAAPGGSAVQEDPAPGSAPQAEPAETWEERLATAQRRIELARERVTAAKAAYSRARHDRNPRGPALATIEQERETAERELRDAEAALPELVEQARREGVPPAVLDPYWE